MTARDSIRAAIDRDGYAVVPGVVESGLARRLASLCPQLTGAGLRNAFTEVPELGSLASLAPVQSLVLQVLGAPGFVTRAILFDKNPGANWSLGFHQDTAIAVQSRAELEGFGPWSIKAGVHHVRPPAETLEGMITVRIHLDDCGPDNGPLQLIPGSHRHGLLEDSALAQWTTCPAVTCEAQAGDAVLMRPLVLHASSKSQAPTHRRVAHFEFAARPLPLPLRWHEPLSADSQASSASPPHQRA